MWIDIVLLAVAALGFSVGFARGIIQTIFTVLSYGLGVIAALRFSPAVTNGLKSVFGYDSPFMFIAGMIVTFAVTMLFIRMLARGMENMLKTANINIINQVLGGALTGAITILVYSVMLNFILKTSSPEVRGATAESRTYEYIKEYPSMVWEVVGELRPIITDFYNYSIDMMDQIEDMTERTESDNYFYDIDDENNSSNQ